MCRWLAHSTAPITWTLFVAMGVTFSVSCATAPITANAALACCTAMGHDCAKSDDDHDCCSSEAPQVDQFLASAKVGVAAAASAAETITALIFPPPASPHRHFGLVSYAFWGHPAPTRVPKYLLISTLLI